MGQRFGRPYKQEIKMSNQAQQANFSQNLPSWMNYLKVLYSTGTTTRITDEQLAFYHLELKAYDDRLVLDAVRQFVRNDTKGFPPSIGQIIAAVKQVQGAMVETRNEAKLQGTAVRYDPKRMTPEQRGRLDDMLFNLEQERGTMRPLEIIEAEIAEARANVQAQLLGMGLRREMVMA